MKKRLLLFDIDGTLIDTGGAGVQALAEIARQTYGDNEGLRGIEVAGRTDTGIVRQILAKQNVVPNDENIAAFVEAYLPGLARELPLRHGKVLPGIAELLPRLQAAPENVLALLTGNMERAAKLKLEFYGLWHFFEFGAFADDHHERDQLGPFAQKRAREKHAIDFRDRQVDVIGDTPHDIACGKAIGARTIAVSTGNFSTAELARHAPDFLLPDFSDVAARIEELGWETNARRLH